MRNGRFFRKVSPMTQRENARYTAKAHTTGGHDCVASHVKTNVTARKPIKSVSAALLICLIGFAAHSSAQTPRAQSKPTVVLVHGAFAESSSWDGVISRLSRDGYHAVAVANPLRGVSADASYVSAILGEIEGPVILVGHSYGGMVITAAALGHGNVKALVYVDAFEPDTGETGLGLSKRFPGSTLAAALAPAVTLPDGNQDLYILQDKFHAQFAADASNADALQMAVTQRPIVQAALVEPSGPPAWRTIPSWSIYGGADRNIPPAALAFMAERAHSRHTVEVKGASHMAMVSHPVEVTAVIEEAERYNVGPTE
jgi:pimeloyl-ACP methyl ester carboxylesterase